MLQKVFQKITRSIFILFFVFSCSLQINAQVEFKLNLPAALFGFFQTGLEFPIGNDFGVETELIFFAIDGEVGGGVLVHGKYYFNPDYGSDKIYIGILTGGLGGGGDSFAAFGFEVGYKWIGKRNILFEIGGGVGRATADINVLPYGRLMLGYRFLKQ
ncbi:MAG: hypothetical protein ACJAT4_001236 [Granulosicoccus sp.]|jgi:hypothetical protein